MLLTDMLAKFCNETAMHQLEPPGDESGELEI
jgi:hypothetical protein